MYIEPLDEPYVEEPDFAPKINWARRFASTVTRDSPGSSNSNGRLGSTSRNTMTRAANIDSGSYTKTSVIKKGPSSTRQSSSPIRQLPKEPTKQQFFESLKGVETTSPKTTVPKRNLPALPSLPVDRR
jgi:hypothetical protein